MAKLEFNVYGWELGRGVKSLVQSFMLAASAINREHDKVLEAQRDYQHHVEAGRPPIGEWDEDGSTIWTQDQILDLELRNIGDASMALRKAHALQLYHLWERSAQAWTSSTPNTGHSDLVKKSLAAGYPIDPRLEAVKHLANTLKHGNPTHGRRLHAAWPAVLQQVPPPGLDLAVEWYSAVQITDADVLKIADIIASSGPSFHPTGPLT
jgi:hypothetical protein